ncbi:transposase [Streptomyces antimycoticus]|uniref:transposase n=1 Tax=Streptomyces antimycoticus TaxID=68175 RepID=UPI000A393ABF
MSWVCCSRTRTSWGRFPARGGPGLAPGTLAVVSVMQFAERLTDRQPADAVRSRIDWKYLLGLELEDEGFPFSVLSGFRTRLVEHSHEQGVLDRLLSRLSGLDFPRAGGRVRTDATHVLALVRDVNRLEFRTETPRCALEALAVAAGDWLHAAQIADASWQKRYGQRADSYRPPKGDVQRGAFAVQDGADGFTLLDAVHRPDAPAWLRQLPADARSAAGVGPAAPPGRRTRPGDAPAGGRRPPTGQTPAGQPARYGRTLHGQTRHDLGRLQGPLQRDLRYRSSPPDRERGHHARRGGRLPPGRNRPRTPGTTRGRNQESTWSTAATPPPQSSWPHAPRASTSSGPYHPQVTARPKATKASLSPTSRSTGTRSTPSAPRGPRAATGAAPTWTGNRGPWSSSPTGTAATARSAPHAPAASPDA